MERRRFISKAILTITLTGVISGVFWFSGKVFSLSYQQDIGVSFTFNPTLKVTVTSDGACSPADLCIHNLSPGTVSDSNIITVSVLNNTGNGYNLNATVGNDTTFNTRDLIHTDSIGSSSSSSSSSKFSSVDYGSSLSSNTDLSDNTWAYSYSLDDGTTWTNYSGLPLYSDTTNIATLKTSLEPNSNIEGDEIKFKIAAKASSTISSGEYQNIINFYATVQPIPVTLSMAYENAGKTKYNGYYKLQDMDSDICNATEVLDEGSQMQAIDIRDNKVYWITKLQDGHCWMTQNLDLNLDSAKTYTHDDTDLGWGSDTATTSWTPVRSTIVATNSIAGWTNDNNTPYSVDPGDYYWKNLPFYPSTNCYPSNNVQYCSYITKGAGWSTCFATTPYESNGTHGHVGNKYNWSAAIANNNTSGITANTYNNIANSPQNSICPAGWRLPTISGQTPAYTTDGSPNEFARIAALYDNYAGNTSISSEGLEKAPLYMARSGHVSTGVLYHAGSSEGYWSSTVSSSTYARYLAFTSTVVYPGSESYRYTGFSVRCLAR